MFDLLVTIVITISKSNVHFHVTGLIDEERLIFFFIFEDCGI